jgi:hypothetical protein
MDIFQKINSLNKPEYTVTELTDHFKEYGIFTLIFIISFISLIPTPLGPILTPFGLSITSAIFAVFIGLLSVQLLFRIKTPYLPEFIKNKKINVTFLKSKKAMKYKSYLEKIKVVFKSRISNLINPMSIIVTSLIFILLSLIMMIPIVLTNFIPGLMITLVSLALLLNDGLLFIVCLIISVIIIVLYYFVLKKLIKFFV